MLGYVKKQTYHICVNAIQSILTKSRNALYSELFHGGAGVWHETISASFVKNFNLECFNDEEITKLYELVFENNQNSIRYMEPKYITQHMLHQYIKHNPDFLKQYMDNFPEHKIQEDDLKSIHIQQLKKNLHNFTSIDPRYQTPEMILMMKKNTYGVRYYHHIHNIDEIGEELYNDAFEKNPNNIAYIPDKYKTFPMCDKAVAHNISNITHVPTKFQTLAMCKTVTCKNHLSIRYCEYIDMDMLQSIYKQQILVPKKERFKFINYLDDEKVIKILKLMPLLLRVIEKSKLKDIMIKTALETDGYALQYVNDQTPEYIEIALKNQPKAQKYVKHV